MVCHLGDLARKVVKGGRLWRPCVKCPRFPPVVVHACWEPIFGGLWPLVNTTEQNRSDVLKRVYIVSERRVPEGIPLSTNGNFGGLHRQARPRAGCGCVGKLMAPRPVCRLGCGCIWEWSMRMRSPSSHSSPVQGLMVRVFQDSVGVQNSQVLSWKAPGTKTGRAWATKETEQNFKPL